MDHMPKSLYEVHSRMKTDYPEQVAVRYFDAEMSEVRSISFRQYHDDICRFVAYLNAQCIQAHSHIALLAKNSYNFMVAAFGIVLSNCVLVPINPDASEEEIQFDLKHADVSVVIGDGYCEREQLDIEGYRNMSANQIPDLCSLDELCMILYTSGTTGSPKGVMICQKNIISSLNLYADLSADLLELIGKTGYRMSQMIALPMHHMASLLQVHVCAFLGSTVSLCMNLRSIFRDLHLMSSDYICLPPVLIDYFLKEIDLHPEILYDMPILCSAASNAKLESLISLCKKGIVIAQVYAMTETFGEGLANKSQNINDLSSVGKGDPKNEYKIQDGELCIRGECVMLGYYKDSKATHAVIDSEGWFHTGDLATVDENGYYFITGRKKNLIILDNGENVSPEELEQLLNRIPLIRNTIVYEKNKKICARIVCTQTNQAFIRKEVNELNRKLPRFKQIAIIEFTDRQPNHNAVGKEIRIKE